MTPPIAVLMPVHNAERYVAEAVNSILAQTFRDFEFIITDDGSADGSLRILQRYAARDSRIRLISRPNTGLVVALNEMLVLGQNEFIARMDADDVALPDRFARQLECLRSRPQLVCVGGATRLIDESGRFLTVNRAPVGNEAVQGAALEGRTPICHPTAMMRRAAVEAVGRYRAEYMPAEDLDLWLRLGEVGELDNLLEPVLAYRIHSNSVGSLHGVEQAQKMRLACEDAWRRRGVRGTFRFGGVRAGRDRHSRFASAVKYGWWAFNSAERKTALIYGMRAVSLCPHRLGGWKLLTCAALKPRSQAAANGPDQSHQVQ